ncbi:hypothetical protein DITRI_Ditri09bG0104200 [Diplodiscus trichospermus]
MNSKGLRKYLYKCRNVGVMMLKCTVFGRIRGKDYYKRFVIKMSLLKHPLFMALLDRAEEVFDFSTASKLCIPCNENNFAFILQYVAASQQDQKSQLYF